MSKEIIKENTQSDNRAEKLKYYSIGSVVLLVVIVLLVNFLFDKILGKALTFDFSAASQNTISQDSQDYIDSLPADTQIRVVGLFNRPENVSGTKYQYIIPLLDDYVKKSDGKITVEYIDPVEHPSIIAALDPTNSFDLANNQENFVIQYNGKIKVFAPIDCYSYDENYYFMNGEYLITGNDAEYTITNSMYALTQGYSAKAYVITGLKEEGNKYITSVLEAMTVEVAELQAGENFTIPDDCDLLILNGPNTDITEKMYVAMSDYLKRGGKMLIAVDISLDNITEEYTRLNKLVNEMNLNIDPMVISENDPGYQLNGYPVDHNVILADGYTDYSSKFALHSTYARPVRYFETPNTYITTRSVLLTSDSATAVQVDKEGNIVDDGIENQGQYNVAMYSATDGDNAAEMFVFGTLNFTSDEYIEAYGTNDANVELFRSCVKDLLNSACSPTLGIATKSVDNFALDTTKATTSSSTTVLVIFMMVIPILLIAMAVFVYTKRKNL